MPSFRPIYFFLLLFFQVFMGQNKLKVYYKNTDSLYPNIRLDHEKNVISNSHHLEALYKKLKQLKSDSLQTVSFVHIGDSHLQADMLTAVVRKELQLYFGNAGRGFVFPYQLAKSNGPNDYVFDSNSIWEGSRLVKKNGSPCGLGGFVAQTSLLNSSLHFKFRNGSDSLQRFDKITLFANAQIKNISFENQPKEVLIENGILRVMLSNPLLDFKVSFLDSVSPKIYGLSLENSKSKGVLYHTIGVNGAKFSDYNEASLFWEQLPQLHADCYIFSMGTNEAQNFSLTQENFITTIDESIRKIKSFNPNAVFIITTPPVSYYHKKYPNKKLKELAEAVTVYCNQNNIAFWDLFAVSNELQGANEWRRKQLLGHDLVHFTRKGYEVQGYLFAEALLKSWNGFVN